MQKPMYFFKTGFGKCISIFHEEADHFALGIVKNSDPGAGAVVPVQLWHI